MGNERTLNTRMKLLAVAVGLAWSGMAGSATLGNISVLSGRGQPLQAEIELVLGQASEADGLVVKAYSPEEYWNPGALPPANSLRDISVLTEKRSEGRYVVKLATAAAVDTQQVAVLAEVSSSAGRIVREYIVQLPNPKSAAVSDAKSRILAETGASVLVKPGDNLNKVASANKPADVSIERMLVALYRANPQAFSGKNMNRLKAGKVLRLPTASELADVAQPVARKEIRVQVADWNAYRQKISSHLAAPAEDAPRQAAGKIGSSVSAQDTADKSAHQEVLKLSKGDVPTSDKSAAEVKSLKDKLHAMEEDLIAREQALQESKDRIAMLEKNNREMQRLLELKAAAAESAVSTQASPPAAQSEPVATSAPVPVSAPEAEPVAQSAVAPADVKEPTPEAKKPGSLVPIFLWGGAAALLGGLAAFLFWRRRSAAKPPKKTAVTSPAKASPTLPDDAEMLVSSAIAEAGAEAAVDLTSQPLSAVEESPAAQVSAATIEEASIPAQVADISADEFVAPRAAAPDRQIEADTDAARVAAELEAGFAALDEFPAPPAPESVKVENTTPASLSLPPEAVDLGLDVPSFLPDAKAAEELSEVELLLDDQQAESASEQTAEANPSAGQEKLLVTTSAAEEAPVSFEPSESVETGVAVEVSRGFGAAENGASPAVEAQPVLSSSQDAVVTASAPDVAPVTAPVSSPVAESAEPLELAIPTIADYTPPDTTLPPLPGMEGVDLNLIDDTNLTEEELQAKGEQWLQVATKLDLARAYQEMGDDAGAREILDEVVVEGDAEQKATAQQLLQMLPPA